MDGNNYPVNNQRLACDLTLPTSLGAETVRLREVTACLQEEATPIISRHIDTCFRYRSHLQPFTWPRNCSAGGTYLTGKRARGSLFNGWTALGWAAGEFRCIALALLRSMIVHRSRHGDHCPCCTYMFLRFIDAAIPSFGHWGNSLS